MTTPTRVCMAVDPGLAHVGYGIVGRYGAKLDIIDSGHIPTKPAPGIKDRDAEAKRIDLNRRLREIWRALAVVVREYRPEIVAIEDQAPATIGARMRGLKDAAAGKGEKSGGFSAHNDPVFEVVGIAKAVAFSYGIPVALYVPEHAKKAVSANGKAKKDEVIRSIRIYFPGVEKAGHQLGEHEADAIAGAIYAERTLLLESKRARRRSA